MHLSGRRVRLCRKRGAEAAQRHWAVRPLEERIRLVLEGVERVGAANKEVVPELAWQMGRPIRYGGEFGA